MGQPEPKKKDEPIREESSLVESTPQPNIEILSDIEDYQHRIESQWEVAKESYQKKINHILDEFIDENLTRTLHTDAAELKETISELKKNKLEAESINSKDPKASPFAPSSKARMDELMSRAEKALEAAEKKAKHLSYSLGRKPSRLNLDWQPLQSHNVRTKPILGIILAGIVAGTFFLVSSYRQIQPVTPLPYAHTSGLTMADGKVYVVDWFRKNLYVHSASRDLPIIAVENLPNEFLTGFAASGKKIWSMDNLNRQILEHSLLPEHPVVKKTQVLGKKPMGLFFDGYDVWSADDESKTLYRHKGNDLDEIRDQFHLPGISITAFALYKNRIWILSQKSREVTVCRLGDPVKTLATYDLDSFLDGAVPTGIAVESNKIYVTTESPARLVKITRRQLASLKPEKF